MTNKDPDSDKEEIRFKKLVKKESQHTLELDQIFPVYNYFNEELKAHTFIFYAEVENTEGLPKSKTSNFGWFTKSEIIKLPLHPQTRQDILVGQRVIDSKLRRIAGEQTID